MIRHTRPRTLRAQQWLILLMIGALLITPWPGPAAPAPAVQAQTGTRQTASQDYNSSVGPPYLLPGWGNLPWAAPQYYTTIQLGDLDGDGKDELIGRAGNGITVQKFDSTLGQWLPVLAADGTILRGPCSDKDGWGSPQYYLTIQLADIDGKPGKELIARGAGGINVVQFTNETKSGSTFPAGAWKVITDSGPFKDGVNGGKFTDSKSWDSDPSYYTTIQLADIDRQPGDELVGRGGDGLEVYKWNGTGWTQLPGLPALADNQTFGGETFRSESLYKTIQFADIDGRPGKDLLIRTPLGITAYKYDPGIDGGPWFDLIQDCCSLQPFSNEKDFFNYPDKYWTLQTADLDGDGVDEVLGRGQNGMMVVKLVTEPPIGGYWTVVADHGPFTDPGWAAPQFYKTIQLADINGDQKADLLARGSDGMHAYQWDAGAKSWTEISSAVPALADDPWAKGEQYYTTIQTGNIDGDEKGQVELLARGPTGVRTWFWRNNTWARFHPYGSFPDFSGDQAAAYTALNTFLGIVNGHIRDVYTDPTRDDISKTLSDSQKAIIGTCSGETSGAPQQFNSCTPPVSGVSTKAWTDVSNQILAETFWAQQAIEHFNGLGKINDKLFSNENSEFPSIGDDIKLSEVAGKTASVSYFEAFLNFLSALFNLVGSLLGPEADALVLAGDAIGTAMSAGGFSPDSADPFSDKFEHTYADIGMQIAKIQQQTQNAVMAQRHHVTGDYGLLRTVGSLVHSQVWTLDEAGTLSASRYGFTKWVYQAFLPLLWDRFVITNCKDTEIPRIICLPPASGPYMRTTDGGVNFTAILNKNPNPCNLFLSPVLCSFSPPDPALFGVVNTHVSPQCTYQPGTTNAWVYGQCTLGVADEIFNNTGGWNFTTRTGNPVVDLSSTLAGGSCNTICFRGPEYYLRRLEQLPRGAVAIAGNGIKNSIGTDNQSTMKLALDGGNSDQDRFNRYFVAAQLGLLAAPGADQGALASRLECYGLDFNPIRLSNGQTLSPTATLGTLLELARQAARGGDPADLEPLGRLLGLLTGDDPAGRCSTGGQRP